MDVGLVSCTHGQVVEAQALSVQPPAHTDDPSVGIDLELTKVIAVDYLVFHSGIVT